MWLTLKEVKKSDRSSPFVRVDKFPEHKDLMENNRSSKRKFLRFLQTRTPINDVTLLWGDFVFVGVVDQIHVYVSLARLRPIRIQVCHLNIRCQPQAKTGLAFLWTEPKYNSWYMNLQTNLWYECWKVDFFANRPFQTFATRKIVWIDAFFRVESTLKQNAKNNQSGYLSNTQHQSFCYNKSKFRMTFVVK